MSILPPKPSNSAMTTRILLRLLALIPTLGFLAACTVVEDAGSSVGRKFDQGLTGSGQLIQTDPTRDSFGPEYR